MINRAQAPAINELQAVVLLQPTWLLSNSGIEVCWIRELSSPVFHLQIELGGGKLRQNKALQSSFATDLIQSGTKSYSQVEIANAIDSLGVFLNFETGKTSTLLHVYGLNERFDEVLPWIREILLDAIYPNEFFERLRASSLQKYEINIEKTAYLARRAFLNALFPNHPYGGYALEEDFHRIAREDCFAFYDQHLKGKISRVHLVGNLEQTKLNNFLNFLDDFQLPESVLIDSPGIAHEQEIYIEKLDAVQSTIRIGKSCISPRDKDYQKLDILDTILGGYFGSRLMQNLREKNGFTYGVGSGITNFDDASYFFVGTDVGKKHKDAALESIEEEISRLRNERIEQDELSSAKAYIRGQILKSTDGALAQMNMLQFAQRFNLSADYVNEFLNTLNELDPDQLQHIAMKHLDWSKMSKVVAG